MSETTKEVDGVAPPKRSGLAEGWPDLVGGLLIIAVMLGLFVVCLNPNGHGGARHSDRAAAEARRAQIEREIAAGPALRPESE
jgi:hypothetical protein